MNYLRFKVEDFIMDESFQQYCTGTNPAAVRFWEQWLQEHPEKKELIAVAQELYQQLNGGLNAKIFAAHHQQFSDALLAKGIINEGRRPKRIITPPRHNGWKWYSLAAASLLAICLTSVWWLRSEKLTDIVPRRTTAYVSQPGEKKSFQLPDGSKVVLNAGSKLELEDSFNTVHRNIHLEGEAFFDVAQNASLPMVIYTAEMDVKVLGTAFNIRAYANETTNETALIRGLVEVSIKSENKKLLLHPNEKVVLTRNISSIQPMNQTTTARTTPKITGFTVAPLTHLPEDSAAVEVSWIDNRLIFSDEPLEEIAKKLERWYNVKIQFGSDNIRRYRFTGNFNKENIRHVLDAMKLSRDFGYSQANDSTIILR